MNVSYSFSGHVQHVWIFIEPEPVKEQTKCDPAAAEAVGVWKPAWITQRSSLNMALQFLVCETKESVVTFVSRWYGTKPLTSGNVSAAAKSYLWLLIADQGLITLINGQGIWGPDLWGLLSVSVQLKRSHRKPEERVSPVSAISGLTADTSQMDLVALVQNGMFGERYLLLTIRKPHQEHLRLEGKKSFHAFPSEYIFYFSLSYTQAPFLNYVP